jgi:RND family efflux transporter MFP subunit
MRGKKMLRMSRKMIWVAVVAGILTVLAGCGDEPRPVETTDSRPTVAVPVETAKVTEIPGTFEATGSVVPWVRVSPGTKILGRVESAAFRVGDRVRKGRVLVTLEKRDLEAALEQATAAVAMTEAGLERARSQYERMTKLHERGSVTDKMLEDATAGFRVAEASLARARANLAAAEVTVSYAEIATPVSGWVVSKKIEPGDMAAPGAPLFTVEDLSKVKIVLDVAESEVVGLAEGHAVQVRVDVLRESRDAAIDRVVPAGDPVSRTYEVHLVLDNPDGRLKSGMFVRASFTRGSRDAMQVPAAAVVERGQLRGLFIVGDDSRARLRWVRLGKVSADGIEVLSGLEPGERFVSDAVAGLVDGVPVEAR